MLYFKWIKTTFKVYRLNCLNQTQQFKPLRVEDETEIQFNVQSFPAFSVLYCLSLPCATKAHITISWPLKQSMLCACRRRHILHRLHLVCNWIIRQQCRQAASVPALVLVIDSFDGKWSACQWSLWSVCSNHSWMCRTRAHEWMNPSSIISLNVQAACRD